MEGAAQSNHQQNNIMDSYESTENALMDSFKAAALKVTTLYKDSLVQNRKSYAAGYQQALQDLYEFISAQPENGYIPVQDVLSFARQKNNQLTCEMGGSSTASPANNPPTTAAATTQPPVQQIVTPSSRLQQQQQQQQNDELLQQQQKFVGNPFQIDPHSQFTFTHDIVPLSNGRTVDGVWDQATNNSTTTEGFKRRMMPAEVSFMGRSMSMDAWHEQQPPLKRGRLRREEQLQLQLQQQQQQLLQQQQHMFQQQQQQQQQQNNAQSSQFHQL
ncbi:hypothetical protein MAM1_0075d04342 [Mucor ambiguus]|uniref:Uncharacterized protein n=1 Tax=Mucor ambiguus TaxID=91626 RepID=A0A0C9M5L1_9FUNG|nr:hypothetical protein MAM1_0075d04342 [Mucor ambiguus]